MLPFNLPTRKPKALNHSAKSRLLRIRGSLVTSHLKEIMALFQGFESLGMPSD
jgi:hypothetical protein